MKKMINKIPALLYGAVFGIANVIPGVSGGTMMVVFGCYDIICGALALDFKHIKKHFFFLLAFAFGAAAGIFGFSFAAKYLFENYPVPTFLFFIGLILGSFPVISKKLFSKGKLKVYHIIFMFIALAAVIGLSLAGESAETAEAVYQTDILTAVKFFSGGFAAAAAMIIPGISGSFMLVLFGVYNLIITAVTELDLFVLIPAGIGILCGLVLGAKAIKFLLSRFHTAVYSIITGLVAGSVFAIFPSALRFDLTLFIGIIAFVSGLMISFMTGRKKFER
ncbi:MAG: DUF368 domain-containing protein [Oscillospiraceae bacterium]|nr:DUF368 domain-containing protein [Oscillospiraceae bacterium]